MKVICKNGQALPVDDSTINENTYMPYASVVTMISDDVYLKPVWIATLQKNNNEYYPRNQADLDFIVDEIYDHEPSEQEIIYLIAKNGLSLNGYVTVNKSYKLDVKEDDEI